MRNLLASAALAATLAAVSATAAPILNYGALALSPSGEQIATLEAGASAHAVVTVRDARSGRVLRTLDPCAKCDYSGLTYAADGSLAFLARDKAGSSVAVMVARAGAAQTVATVAGLAQTPRFSPDGRRIALLVTLGAAKETGATQAGARQVGEIGEKPDEQRLAVVDLTGGASRAVTPLSPEGRYVYEYDWTPDGRGFVATTALGNGDNNWWVATLDAIDAGTGAVRPIAALPTQANFPRVSPDGRTVAYIGGLMSDFGSVGGDIWSVPLAGGTPVNRTPGVKLTFTSLAWTKGGLRATTLAGDQAAVVPVDLSRGVGPAFYSAPVTLGAGDARAAFSADGRTIAATVQDWERAPAIYAGVSGAMRQLTHDNDAVAPITRARSIIWTSGGYRVQGWLLQPLTPPAGGKAPMIVNVHGGPSAATTPRFLTAGGEGDLLAKGYYLFLPNPRGSYGQGEAFTAANKRDFGYGDLKDILAGVDAVEKVAPVDDARLGLMGGSYGGFMSMWANTQTNRFKAIVASAGISNWISYYGTNGIDQWMIPFMGKSAYDDPAAYRRMSAIDYIRQAKTPTLILVGERDIEVPPTQSLEYWHALKAMNVPTTLVIYPDEGHGIRDPKNAADAKARGLAWFDKYLGTN